jgi:hypothetical protein
VKPKYVRELSALRVTWTLYTPVIKLGMKASDVT